MPQFADKYDTPQALEQGFRELDKMVSSEMGRPPLADSAVLVGDTGMFKTHADLAASYTKTATAHGKIKAPPAPNPTANPPAPGGAPKIGGGDPPVTGPKIGGDTTVSDDEDSDAIITKAGLSKADLVKQWDSEGKLTEAQYTAIQAARPGLGKALINQLARGMAAESAVLIGAHNKAQEESEKIVGGKAQLDALLRVEAPKFLPKEQWEPFDKMLKDPRTRSAAVRTLSVMHAEAVGAGKASAIIGGTSAGGGGIGGKPTTAQELGKLMRQVQEGDKDAVQVLRSMSPEEIEKFQRM